MVKGFCARGQCMMGIEVLVRDQLYILAPDLLGGSKK